MDLSSLAFHSRLTPEQYASIHAALLDIRGVLHEVDEQAAEEFADQQQLVDPDMVDVDIVDAFHAMVADAP